MVKGKTGRTAKRCAAYLCRRIQEAKGNRLAPLFPNEVLTGGGELAIICSNNLIKNI